MRKFIFVLAILLVFSGCSSANKTENKITTTTTVAERKIKLNSGDFLLCFYNGQNPTAKVFKINSDRTVTAYEKTNNYYEDMLLKKYWENDITPKKTFKLTKKEYNKLKNNINKVFIKEYEYSYAQDGNNVIIVTNTNEDEIIAICNKKEVKLLNNEISKISYNIYSVLNKYYNVDPYN